MPILIGLAFAFPGFVALTFGMERHQEELLGKALSQSSLIAWRCIGVAGLGLALAVCLQAWSVSVGVATWFGLLTFAGMMVGMFLTYKAHLLVRVAGLSACLGALIWLCQ